MVKYCFLFIFLIIPTKSVAQRYQVTPVLRGSGEANKYLPLPNSIAYKQSSPHVSTETEFALFLVNYKDEKKNSLEQITKGYLKKGENVVYEIVPEFFIEDNTFRISFRFPGYICGKYIHTRSNHTFKWITYSQITDEIRDSLIPLMIIYEDNAADNIEIQLDNLTMNKSLPLTMNSNLETEIFKVVKSFFLISYQLNKRE